MNRDRSVFIVFLSDRPTELELLADAVARAGLHVLGLDVWCEEGARGGFDVALVRLRQGWPWVPPLRWLERGPGSSVRTFSRGLAVQALYGRLQALTAEDFPGVAVLAVAGSGAWSVHLAMTLMARPEDQLAGLGLERVPFVRVRALGLPAFQVVSSHSYGELCTLTAVAPSAELTGRLRRHAVGWSYSVWDGQALVDRRALTDKLGAALAAALVSPGSPGHELHRLACSARFGWAPPSDDDEDDVEIVNARVNQWFSRLRRALRPWTSRGLSQFVPAPVTRLVAGRVDIDFDPALPWTTPPPESSCAQDPISMATWTSGSISTRG